VTKTRNPLIISHVSQTPHELAAYFVECAGDGGELDILGLIMLLYYVVLPEGAYHVSMGYVPMKVDKRDLLEGKRDLLEGKRDLLTNHARVLRCVAGRRLSCFHGLCPYEGL